jgi:hypothetical protein
MSLIHRRIFLDERLCFHENTGEPEFESTENSGAEQAFCETVDGATNASERLENAGTSVDDDAASPNRDLADESSDQSSKQVSDQQSDQTDASSDHPFIQIIFEPSRDNAPNLAFGKHQREGEQSRMTQLISDPQTIENSAFSFQCDTVSKTEIDGIDQEIPPLVPIVDELFRSRTELRVTPLWLHIPLAI